MTQQKLGAMVGVSYRTIRAWEVDGRYPKQSSLYQKLADAFQCRVSYPMNDDETVCVGNDEPSEYSGAKQARQILEQAAALFASGTMTNCRATHSGLHKRHIIISNFSKKKAQSHLNDTIMPLFLHFISSMPGC